MGFRWGCPFAWLAALFVKPDWKQVAGTLTTKPEIVLRTYTVPPVPPEPPPPVPPPQGRVASKPPEAAASLTTRLELVQQPDPEKEIADMKTLATSAVGNSNKEGPEVTGAVQAKEPEAPGGNGTKGGEINGNEGESFISVERQPEFPGGMQAWIAFLSRHLQTPDNLEPGERKAVLVSFVVDKDGSVTGFRVVQSGGRRFDDEVIRVLRKMPKWKPAIQNGHPVALSYTQPVTFVGVEQ